MVHWNVDKNEDAWLNEGLSELSALITGYGASNFAAPFLNAPDIQLNTWPEEDNRGLHYGAAFLFAAYFYERYGEAATTTLVSDPKNGLDSVDNALTAIAAADPATGEPVAAVDLFGDWVVANLLHDPAVGDGRIATRLRTRDLGVARGDAQRPDRDARRAVMGATICVSWRGRAHRCAHARRQPDGVHHYGGTAGRICERPTGARRQPPDAPQLTGVEAAALSFWTVPHRARLDYAYLLVSTDGGATWTPLETAHTTNDNPHSNAYGPGYTGESGGWLQETVDLTPYAGQNILIRFEYITDDAVTQPGMLIDDISIPEIGFSDDAETADPAWTTSCRSASWCRSPSRGRLARLWSAGWARMICRRANGNSPWAVTMATRRSSCRAWRRSRPSPPHTASA